MNIPHSVQSPMRVSGQAGIGVRAALSGFADERAAFAVPAGFRPPPEKIPRSMNRQENVLFISIFSFKEPESDRRPAGGFRRFSATSGRRGVSDGGAGMQKNTMDRTVCLFKRTGRGGT
ncbi:MAG: hypothetical protein OXH59_04830 [Rhodospirillaceae bacterium]|nr:hypothetical protein [Rhodospirillaceae bacterium]